VERCCATATPMRHSQLGQPQSVQPCRTGPAIDHQPNVSARRQYSFVGWHWDSDYQSAGADLDGDASRIRLVALMWKRRHAEATSTRPWCCSRAPSTPVPYATACSPTTRRLATKRTAHAGGDRRWRRPRAISSAVSGDLKGCLQATAVRDLAGSIPGDVTVVPYTFHATTAADGRTTFHDSCDTYP